jgi:hypothetical protein
LRAVAARLGLAAFVLRNVAEAGVHGEAAGKAPALGREVSERGEEKDSEGVDEELKRDETWGNVRWDGRAVRIRWRNHQKLKLSI